MAKSPDNGSTFVERPAWVEGADRLRQQEWATLLADPIVNAIPGLFKHVLQAKQDDRAEVLSTVKKEVEDLRMAQNQSVIDDPDRLKRAMSDGAAAYRQRMEPLTPSEVAAGLQKLGAAINPGTGALNPLTQERPAHTPEQSMQGAAGVSYRDDMSTRLLARVEGYLPIYGSNGKELERGSPAYERERDRLREQLEALQDAGARASWFGALDEPGDFRSKFIAYEYDPATDPTKVRPGVERGYTRLPENVYPTSFIQPAANEYPLEGSIPADLRFIAAERDTAMERYETAIRLLGLRKQLEDARTMLRSSSSTSTQERATAYDPKQYAAFLKAARASGNDLEMQKYMEGRSLRDLNGNHAYFTKGSLTEWQNARDKINAIDGLKIALNRLQTEGGGLFSKLDPAVREGLVNDIASAWAVLNAQGAMTDDEFQRAKRAIDPGMILNRNAKGIATVIEMKRDVVAQILKNLGVVVAPPDSSTPSAPTTP